MSVNSGADYTSIFSLSLIDHGESLGENGIYLHGLPRFIAPAEQQEIPMLAWLSPELKFMDNGHFDVAFDRSAEKNERQSADIIVSQ